MAQAPPTLEQKINEALEQARAELVRFYSDGDVGTITLHVGKKQIRVKATPERSYEPVQFE